MFGSINMDLVVRVKGLPRPGDTVLGDRLRTVPGGKGANQAVAAARLGASVQMVGRVGDDAFGRTLIAGLREDNVDISAITVDDSQASGVALIVVDEDGQNMITVAPGANSDVGEHEIGRLREMLGPDQVLVLQLEIPIAAVLRAIAAAHDAGARVILNAAPSGALAGEPVPDVDLLIVNETEAEDLGLERLRQKVRALAVTLGARGSVLYHDGAATPFPSRRVEVVDATAAGDAFVGAAAFALSRGSSIASAVRLGCDAGAAAVTQLGARPSLPRPEDLKRLFDLDIDAAMSAAEP